MTELPRQRVLVVDGEAAIRALHADLPRSLFDAYVDVVDDGTETLALFASNRHDLVVHDTPVFRAGRRPGGWHARHLAGRGRCVGGCVFPPS